MSGKDEVSAPERFAKLFERDGHQVLVTKDQDDEGEPMLRIRFKSNVSGHDIATAIRFKKDTVLDKWAVLDRGFDAMDEARAFDLRNCAPGIDL